MKVSTVQIQYDSEKLSILKRYIKNETELTMGLEAYLQTLYEQNVPTEIRKAIDRKEKGDAL